MKNQFHPPSLQSRKMATSRTLFPRSEKKVDQRSAVGVSLPKRKKAITSPNPLSAQRREGRPAQRRRGESTEAEEDNPLQSYFRAASPG